MWHSYCCYGNHNITFCDFCTHVLKYNASFMYCLVINFLLPHQSLMDYFLTRGRLLSWMNFFPFQSKWEFYCQLSRGASFHPRPLLQIHLLRNMPWKSDSGFTYAEQKGVGGKRERNRKSMNARQQGKTRKQDKVTKQEIKKPSKSSVPCQIYMLYMISLAIFSSFSLTV